MAEKRYYWLKLQDGFFDSKRIKKLRRLAGGDTYTIIYLKMQLLAMKHNGVLEYTGLEPTFAEELALDIDESADNVSVTVSYLLSCGLLETNDQREYFVPYAVANTGSEGSSAKRMREARAKSVTLCEQRAEKFVQRYVEKEIEKEKETEIEKDVVIVSPAEPQTTTKRFKPPTREEVQAYCLERGNSVDVERFIDHYTSNGWKVGRNAMKDWKAAVRTWERSQIASRGKADTGFETGNPFLEMLNEERMR